MNFEEYASGLKRRWLGRSAALVVLRDPGSTHRLARRVVAEYNHEGCSPPKLDLVAWEQTAGTGRHRRSWRSPPGQGAYITLVRSGEGGVAPQLLPLTVALALCELLRSLGSVNCRLKWPNDLFVGSRKVGGILIDRVGEVSILSFGINAHGPVANFIEPRATFLAADGLTLPPLDLLTTEMITAVDSSLEGAEPCEVVEKYRACSIHEPGESMVCRIGENTVRGVFLGFDPRGFLRLEVGGVERIVAAGELIGDV